MSYGSNKHSESSASRRSMDGDTTEDGGDDRDETKRRSRNLSEKKRRDQFNVLIHELCSMVSTSARKMDKSTVLKATIAFLKAHNELSVQSQVQETQEDWKPSFLSNEEFTHLMLEALDGFIIVISSVGKILYLSESITSLLGYLSSDLVNGSSTIYDYVLPEERNDLYGILTNPAEEKYKSQVSIVVNFRVGGLEECEGEQDQKYQMVKLVGYFKRWISPTESPGSSTAKSSVVSSGGGSGVEKGGGCGSGAATTNTGSRGQGSGDLTGTTESTPASTSNGSVLVATGRLVVCDLLREMSVVVDSEKNEFSSRHSLEWKFLFLDHRAPPIIGYLPFEVLGTSGYDYYHVEDLEKVAICHEALMQRGEGTSCYYRFLTKGQQWIWLQTRFYITYHQWNSKPEFIVCTHRVVSYEDVMKELRGEAPTSAFEESPSAPRLGPSLAKQPKLEISKSSSSLRSGRHKNGNLSYGSIGSKRNSSLRKLELPPKFATVLSSSNNTSLIQPPSPNHGPGPGPGLALDLAPITSISLPSINPGEILSSSPLMGIGSGNGKPPLYSPAAPVTTAHATTTVAVASHPHPQPHSHSQLVTPHQHLPHSQHQDSNSRLSLVDPAVVTIALTTGTENLLQNPTPSFVITSSPNNIPQIVEPCPPHPTPMQLAPAPDDITAAVAAAVATTTQPPVTGTDTGSSQCILQEQLLKKHAELQRQIFQQQEELRRVSEQLLMSQVGWIQGDSNSNPLLLPPVPGPPPPGIHLSHHPQDDDNNLNPGGDPTLQQHQPLMEYGSHPVPACTSSNCGTGGVSISVSPTPPTNAAPATDPDTGESYINIEKPRYICLC